MRSSSGEHFIALDHVRAVAALLVFNWHFLHGVSGSPIPFSYAPSVVPLTLLDEGHTGVALFMTLSGYLFAKLLDGRRVNYRRFVWNRCLRLLPLLVFALALELVRAARNHHPLAPYASMLASGLVLPTLPNGGWSITVEFHFYLLLPLLLWLRARYRSSLVFVVLAAIGLRAVLYSAHGEVEHLAYYTLVGRIDQFTLGILAFQYRSLVKGRHALALSVLGAFVVWAFQVNLAGGFFPEGPNVASPSPRWILVPALEGIAYAVGIAYYDSTFSPKASGVSFLVGRLGAYSYSIYLFHFFIVFRLAGILDARIGLSNFYLACAFACAGFLAMLPLGYLSFRFLEAPFLKLRKPYLEPRASLPATP